MLTPRYTAAWRTVSGSSSDKKGNAVRTELVAAFGWTSSELMGSFISGVERYVKRQGGGFSAVQVRRKLVGLRAFQAALRQSSEGSPGISLSAGFPSMRRGTATMAVPLK